MHFLDVENFTRYHVCAAAGQPSKHFQCPSGSVYISKESSCGIIDDKTELPQNINCADRANEVVVYISDPAYYVLCFDKKYVFRCPDVENQIYNETSAECVYQCRSAGVFKDRLDCNSYYVCDAAISGGFVSKHVQCPKKHYFNETQCSRELLKCVSDVDKVKPKSIGTSDTEL